MEKTNKLVLCRGLPGSGKSTLAEKLAKNVPDSVVIAADDFFMVDGDYKFTFDYLVVAHQWCIGQAFYHLFRGKTVFVTNTFVEYWTMDKYVEAAHKAGIPWEIVEPSTKWKSDPAELSKKNVHGVSEAAITKMREKWEPTKQILEKLSAKGW